MSPYVYGLLTFPVGVVAVLVTLKGFVMAWDAWEAFLKKAAPKWYPVESNADVGAILGTYSGRLLRISFPGGGAFILTSRGRMPSAQVRNRAKWAIWKVVQDSDETTP